MAASISSSIIACLKSFNEFIEEIRLTQQANIDGLVPGAWEDELGRLRLWAANIGAHQTGQSSLDFRLRDASHIREQIVKLLQSLLRRLQDARDVLAEDEETDDEEVAELVDEEDPKTEIQELQESVATNINCLFQMSMLVRNPAQHDFLIGAKGNDVAAFEPFDYNHVREKYPRADDALVKRLGNAITRRRKYLKYRERHAMKLNKGIDNVNPRSRDFQEVHEGETMKEGTTSILSDTVATDFQHQNIDFDDNASDTGTQTSYAPTLLGEGNITIPPLPKSSLGGVPFECPYCFYLITVHGTRSWNKHVFQDLQPYICVASTCATPEKLYPTRHEWVHHSKMAHPAAVADDGTPEETKGFAACPLCMAEVELGKQRDRHIARHLQELALFILPGSEEDSGVSDDQEAESLSGADSIDLAASPDRSKSPDDLPSSPVEYHAADGKTDSKQGQEEEAGILETQLTEKRTILGSEHPDTLTTMANLASIYKMQGRWDEALELTEQVMMTRTKVLGREHPSTLKSMNNLASIYTMQGRLNKALELTEQVMMTRTKVLGHEHPDTLTIMDALASLYSRRGQFDEALELAKQVMMIRTKKLGHEHPDTLRSMANLASIHSMQGQLKSAEELLRQALSGREKKLGLDHPSTLDTYKSLGILYEKQGRLEEAESMYRRELNGKEKLLGLEHPSTLDAVGRLAEIYKVRQKFVEAEELEQWVLRAKGKK